MLDIHFDSIPVLETARLRLREITQDDAPRWYELRRHPQVTTYLDRENDRDLGVVQELIGKVQLSALQGDGITWAISWKDAPALIGSIGIWRIDKKNHRGEIGYMLHPDHWAKGIMTEALEAVLAFGFQVVGLHSIEANTAVGNRASHALLERHGFRKEAHFRQNWHYNGVFSDSVIYCKLATD